MRRDDVARACAQIRQVDLGPDARGRIAAAVRRAARERREASPRAGRAAGTRGRWAALALAACAVAFAVIVGSGLARGGGAHAFTLTAFADGGSRASVGLGSEFWQGGLWSFSDGPFTSDGTGIADTGVAEGFAVSFPLDLEVKGAGISRVRYAVAEGSAYFRYDPHADPATMPDDFSPRSYSIEPGELDRLLPPFREGVVYVMANVAADAPGVAEAWGAAVQGGGLGARESAAVFLAGAEELARSVIEVTVTFDDGATETHRYRVSPAENFRTAIEAFCAGEDAASIPDVLTIEQLD